MFSITSNLSSHSIQSQNKKIQPYPVCLNCNSFPLLSLNCSSPPSITINCECGYNSTIPLAEYIKKIQSNKRPLDNLCKPHRYQSFSHFCFDCKKNLCVDCLALHIEHNLINLNEELKLIDSMTVKTFEGMDNIYNHMDQTADFLINELLGLINKVKETVETFKKNNDDYVIFFLALLQKSEICRNYYLQQSIIKTLTENNIGNYFTFDYSENDSIVEKVDSFWKCINNYKIVSAKISPSTIKPKQFITTHPINHLILLKNGKIASCSNDSTINIYNKETFSIEQILKGHQGPVKYIAQLPNEDIISCSSDQSIKIWSNYKCIKTIQIAHDNEISQIVIIDKERFATSSKDKTIKIWSSFSPYKLIHKIYIGNFANSILKCKKKDFLLSCSLTSKNLEFWNCNTYQCIETIPDIECYHQNSMIETEYNIVFVLGKNKIYLVDLITFIVIKIIEKEDWFCFYSGVDLNGNNILCGGSNGMIYIFDLVLKKIQTKKTNNKNAIKSLLIIDKNAFISGSKDNFDNLILWHY